MRPVILETQGLVAALRQYAERINQNEEFAVSITNRGYDGQLSTEAEGVVFAIIEEAVGNAKKHANPSEVKITLTVKKEHLKPEGTHYLRITSQKYGTKEVEYAAASTSALTVQFDDPASLTVTVAGYRGSGLENKIRIDVKPTPRENEPRRYTSYYGRNRGGLDAEGVQKFGPLAPGEYDITLSIQQDRSRYLPAETVTTVLKAGDNSETLSLPKLYNLTVIVDAGQEGASFRLNSRDSSRGWYGSSHKKATDGRVVFENLVPGDYTLQAWGSVSGQMYVTIPAQTTVRFEPVVFNAQKVRVRDESGTFVKAGLREGDLVVGIDGEEFLNERQMGALFTLAREKKNVTLTVVRGGRRLQVAVDFTDAYNQKVSGIYWERSSR